MTDDLNISHMAELAEEERVRLRSLGFVYMISKYCTDGSLIEYWEIPGEIFADCPKEIARMTATASTGKAHIAFRR